MTDQDNETLDFDAISSKDIFEEAKDRAQLSYEAESKMRSNAKHCMQFRRGQQWEDAPRTRISVDEIQLTINFTDAMVRRVTNNMKQQRPRGKCHPVGDGADVEKAEVINGIGRHVEARSEASVAYDVAGDIAVTAGWGYCRLISEYVSEDSFDQDLRILPILNPFRVYMDPSAIMPSASDAKWCLILDPMRRTEYKRMYPNALNSSWGIGDRPHGSRDLVWEGKLVVMLAEYFRIREREDTLHMIRRADGSTYTRFKDELPNPEVLASVNDRIEETRTASRKQVEWFRMNGTEVIDRRILPGQWIPIFRCLGNQIDVDGELDRWGMVDPMRDAQKMVNFGEVAKIKRLGLAPQAPWVGAEGQFEGHPEWDDSNTVAHSKLIYKPVVIEGPQGPIPLPPPQRQPPAQLEQGFAEFTAGMRNNLLAIAGMPNDPGQDMQGQVVSGEALRRRQRLSDQSHFQYYDNQTLMIAQLWRVMLEWIRHFMSTERIQRIIGEDGVASLITLNQKSKDPAINEIKNDVSVGRYDVVMDTGPGYDTKREEGSDNLIDLMKSPAIAPLVAQHGPDLLFRSLDYPYMQELADRFSALTPDGLKKIMQDMPARAKALITSLQSQNQQLQQQMQQLQQDLKGGITKAHLAATTKAHDAEISAETKRLDTLVRAHTERDTEEIRGGVQLMKTAMEHGHDERMAERMIKEGEHADLSGGPSGNSS